jgi:hypothetical protein
MKRKRPKMTPAETLARGVRWGRLVASLLLARTALGVASQERTLLNADAQERLMNAEDAVDALHQLAWHEYDKAHKMVKP